LRHVPGQQLLNLRFNICGLARRRLRLFFTAAAGHDQRGQQKRAAA